MRLFVGVCLAAILMAQESTIRTTVPLVTVPVAVMDAHGEPLNGLRAEDFVLLDEGKPRPVRVDTIDSGLAPVALVTLVQTGDMSLAALKKLDKMGGLIALSVVGGNGAGAVITYDSDVKVAQDFTNQPSLLSDAFTHLEPKDEHQGRMLDALDKALDLLAQHSTAQRANILIIGESRDRGSKTKLDELIPKIQRTGATVYTMSYSKLIAPFTMKADEYQPPGADPTLGLIELSRLAKRNAFKALTEATGGNQFRFEVKSKLESDLANLGKDIHNRYLLSFTPETDAAWQFYRIEVQVKGHPDASIRARPGYWSGL